MKKEQFIFYISLIICFIALSILALSTDATSGGGDSYFHYLYARYSWIHPRLFFDHWAKPLFTILASPFAQFGFRSVKWLNVLFSVAACFFTYQTARQLSVKNAFLIALFYFSATLNVTVTLSALTEPLFALVLIVSVWFCTRNQPFAGTVVVSFLPFVRSEGLVVLCVFAVYLLMSRRFKYLPLLLSGHLIIALIGSFYYHDLLWVFNKIPYAKMNSNYGSGSWDHFIIQMNFMIGPVLYCLLVIGGLTTLMLIRKQWKDVFFSEKLFLVYGMFITFFIAHTAFWALGIFNSLGLSRVFVGVMPMIAIISLEGFNTVLLWIKHPVGRKVAFGVLLCAVLIFPFTKNPAAYDLKGDFSEDESQLALRNEVIPYLEKKCPSCKIYSSLVSIPFLMNVDIFDSSKYNMMYQLPQSLSLKKNEVVVWDNWFSVIEEHVSREDLEQGLKLDTVFRFDTHKGRHVEFAVFVSK